MPRIKEASVEAVKAAVDIVDLVGARTQLRRSGARFVGRCPFHEEKTPSFNVSPDRGTYYCFGCQRGGDAITFVQETENLDFAGTIEWLADRFRVPIEYDESSPQADAARRRRERLLAVLEQAAVFYERYLWESAQGETARAYLGSRNLGEEVVRAFRLGLAPTDGTTLVRKAQEKGFTTTELAGAGLANRGGRDYFHGRLLFPLADERGRVRGFQARRLREDDPLRAKYVNSPEGDLFRKGDLLYGLDSARNAIAKADRAIVVEGNTDVLALRQAGVEPVVAAMGTALTERQLRELSRLAHRVVLCFDGDAAGEAATLRGMELAASQGFDVRVVALPRGSDPADDPAAFERHLARAEPYLPYRVRLELERLPDRHEAFVRIRELLSRFEDSPERQDALRLAADRLDLPKETQAGFAPRAPASTGALSARLLDAGERLERDALGAVLRNPPLVPLLAELSSEHFDAEQNRALRAALVERREVEGPLLPLAAELDARAAGDVLDEVAGKQLLLRLRERRLERELRACDEPERLTELQRRLSQVRDTLRQLG